MRRAPLVCALALGLGLVAAPLLFGMFDRAPEGAVMIDEFRPFMTEARIDAFQGYMVEIDEAVAESEEELRPFLAGEAGIDDAEFAARFSEFAGFAEEWPRIERDMTDLLDRVEVSVDNYEAVDALPPFTLFPWFFVGPGLLIVTLATVALVRPDAGRTARCALVALGVALVAAPFAFAMFDRAPKGGEMMSDFETLMTRERVRTIQGYFGSMSVGEGNIRLELIPAAQQAGGLTDAELAGRFPAVIALRDDWIGIINDMTPMIGAMSDNVDNYDAITGLPPFPVFPWFFVGSGLLVVALALAAGRPRPGDSSAAPDHVEAGRRAVRPPERTPAMTTHHPLRRFGGALLALGILASACSSDDSGDSSADDSAGARGSGELVGTFALEPGVCDANGVTGGSYIQLVFPGGTVEDGPFFENPDSACTVKAFTIVSPGSDGGLIVGDYQPHPEPAFDGSGNSLADGVIAPQSFTQIRFSLSTNPTDPQTSKDVPAPEIEVKDGELTGNVSALTASWNNEFFNQGAPKPDGSEPGLTKPVRGTYEEDTGRFVLAWSSQVVGGPFNDFTGIWHLEGTFEPEKKG